MIINDKENEAANKSVASALKELKQWRTDFSLGEVSVVQINRSDARGTLDLICGVWDAKLGMGKDKIPDLVLDTTMTGPGSETVNSFSAALGLPTLTAQFGQEGDIRQWRDLKPEQSAYLVQVMPPADLLPEAIRQLVISMNASNAAILFNEDFVMDHKYKNLLQNVPVRHVIVRAKEPGKEIISQLIRLRNLDIVNFFVLGGQETIKATLDAAQALNFTGRKYAWHGLTLDDFSPECDCANISVLFLKPTPSGNQQAVAELGNKGLLPKPILTSAFYYDLTRLGVMAMRAAIEAGQWPLDNDHLTCESYNGSNTPTRRLPFLEHLKNITSASDGNEFKPTYANFTWGERNGEHHASFNTDITLVTIVNSQPVSTEKIGSWDAGIDRNLEVGFFNLLRY